MHSSKRKSLLALLVSTVFFISSMLFGVYLFQGYFSFRDSLTYSWFSPIFFIFPGLLVFFIAYHGTYFFYDENRALSIGNQLIRPFIYFLLGSIVITAIFSLGYISYLKNNGYTHCPGIPSGWMPGMAAKYAKDDSLCKKKRRLIYKEE